MYLYSQETTAAQRPLNAKMQIDDTIPQIAANSAGAVVPGADNVPVIPPPISKVVG